MTATSSTGSVRATSEYLNRKPKTESEARLASELLNLFRPAPLAYCDFIADVAKRALQKDDTCIIREVGHVKADLHPEGGYLLTMKKTLDVSDRNGRKYRVTVEEIVEPKEPEVVAI